MRRIISTRVERIFCKVMMVLMILVALGYLALAFDYLPYKGLCRQCLQEGKKIEIWYFYLPGYSEVYYPEDTIDLKDWVGSKYDKAKVVDKNEKEIPELTAAMALRAVGFADESYVKKQKPDGHWILYRPAKTEKVFDLRARHVLFPCLHH